MQKLLFIFPVLFLNTAAHADQYLNLDQSSIKILGDPMIHPAIIKFLKIDGFPGEYKLYFENPASFGKSEGYRIDFSKSPFTGQCRDFGGFLQNYAYYCNGVLTIPASDEIKTDFYIKRMHLDLKQGTTGKVVGVMERAGDQDHVTVGKYLIVPK